MSLHSTLMLEGCVNPIRMTSRFSSDGRWEETRVCQQCCRCSRDGPEFMDTYYRSSRLHFIGRWKARIEALQASMASAAPAALVPSGPGTLLPQEFALRGAACMQKCMKLLRGFLKFKLASADMRSVPTALIPSIVLTLIPCMV